MKLHQVIAVEKGVKNECNTKITAAYHEVQKPDLFKGIARTYNPKDEDGERLPSENQKVQRRAEDLLNFTADTMTKYWDMTLTKDTANCEAKADVVVDGQVILKAAPVTFLLFLDKQLGDLATLIKKLPTLDPSEGWHQDAATATYATEVSETHKTKKIPKAFTKAPATKEHPAQVEAYMEDIVVGYWKTIKFSGAMPQKRIDELLERVTKLQAAVKFAREEANSISVQERHVGKALFEVLLG